jgi:hypothetical protein
MWVKYTVFFTRHEPAEMLEIPSPGVREIECIPRIGDSIVIPGAKEGTEEILTVSDVIWTPFRVGKEEAIIVLGKHPRCG